MKKAPVTLRAFA